MKTARTFLAILVLTLSACSLTPTQKRALAITGSIVVVGVIAANAGDKKDSPKPIVVRPGCVMQPDGSCR